MKSILFSVEDVRAILDGRKTVTRRMIKFPEGQTGRLSSNSCLFYPGGIKYPSYHPGDILYVREPWGCYSYDDPESNAAYFLYRADYEPNARGYWYEPEHVHFCDFPRWRPSLQMPKEAARIFLRVTDVKVDKLQCITRDEALREGANPACAVIHFGTLWDSHVKVADLPRYGWDANPWVWVISFERISREEEQKGGEENG